jgi:hypothetical protein
LIICGGSIAEASRAVHPRPVGRPGIKRTAIELFEARRNEGLPLAPTQLGEAKAIVARWPSERPPKAKTVSQRISEVYAIAKSRLLQP